MMSREQSELLTQVGPGTPMGDLFRRYWIPVLLASELPGPDCPPIRVKLLGERLLAFRDSEGAYGLIDEFCAHRGVPLWFGRTESCGIRCPYHGWKFGTDGACLEIPSEPEGSTVHRNMRLKAYPLVERGGVIWAYMGDPEARPPEPGFEWIALPDSHKYLSKRWQETNYLQSMEGGIDSVHVSFLHSADLDSDPLHRSTEGAKYQRDTTPTFEVLDSPGGLLIGARRRAEADQSYMRITQWIMPWYTMVPPYGANALNGHAWVPIDDENCFVWTFTWHPMRPLTEAELEAMRDGGGIHTTLIPGTFRPTLNRDNDYGMDRHGQKAGRTYSGVKGIAMQDASIQESMGPISDRSREHLVGTDRAIIMARRQLAKAATGKLAQPPGLDPDSHRVRSATFLAPADVPLQDMPAERFAAVPGVAPVSI